MSQLGITTDLIISRQSWTAELRAAENDVRGLASRLAASPLKIPAVLDIDIAKLRAAIAQAQAIANANPITIPVTYGAPGGMPGGGGGVPMPTPGGGTMPITGGGNGGGMGGGGGAFRAFRTIMIAKAAYDVQSAGLQAGMIAATDSYHQLTGRGFSTHELQDRAAAISAGQATIRKVPIFGDIAASLGESIQRGGSAALNFARGRGFESDLGYGERLKAIIKLEDEHTKKLEAQAHQHRAIGEHLQREVITLNRRTQLLGNPGMSGAAVANLNAQAATEELNQQLALPEMRDAKGRLTGNAADYAAAKTREIEAQRRADVDRAQRQEFGANARTALAIDDINARANNAEMRSQGRGTEAGYVGARRAINERLTRLGIAYQASADPRERARINAEYQAEFVAGGRETNALNAGMARETREDVRSAQRRGYIADLEGAGYNRQASMYARTSAIDERIRQQQDEVNATKDPTVRANLQKRLDADKAAGGKEKAAIIAEDWRQTLDAIAQYTIQKDQAILSTTRNDGQQQLKIFDETTARIRERMKDRSAEEKRAFEDARKAEREALVEQQRQQHLTMRQQARDIALRARGQGGIADELDIEDEFRANARAAGNDPRAKQGAINLTKARLESYIRGQWQPQIFSSFAQFDEAAQMNLLNRDARGLSRAKKFAAGLNNLRASDDLTSNSEGFGPEDIGNFNAATGKLDQAADKLLNNRLAVVAF